MQQPKAMIDKLIASSKVLIQSEDYSEQTRAQLQKNLEAAQTLEGITVEQLGLLGGLIEAFEVARSIAER